LVEFKDGCKDASDDGGEADKSGDDFRPGQHFFRRDDDGDANNYEWVHHAEHSQNQHRGGAAEAAGRALFAANAKTGLAFRARGATAERRAAAEQARQLPAGELKGACAN
jgi:hypothetical protein